MSRTTDFGDSASSPTHGCCGAVEAVGVLEQLLQRLGPGDLVEQLHPLVVLDAVGLHLADRLAARLVLLRAEHRAGVVQGGLDDRDDVEGVGRHLGVEGVEDREGVRRQRLVEREVELQALDEPHPAAVGLGRVDRSTTPAASSERCCAAARRIRRSLGPLRPRGCRAAAGASRPRGSPGRAITLSSIAWVTRIRETSGSGSAATRRVEGLLGPGDLPLGRLLALHPLELLGVVARLLHQPAVLDDVLGGLDDDGAGGVEAGAPGAAGDLVELARLEHPLPAAVVLRRGR